MHLFLDRDGVINKRKIGAYIQSPDEFYFLEGVLEAMPLLAGIFETVVVVTNQAGIAKGLMTEADLGLVHAKMITEISKAGGRVDGVFYCPHNSKGLCFCRKPRSGMAFQALKKFPTIDFSKSYMVGDSHSDIIFGHGLGMKTFAVKGKKEDEELLAKIETLHTFDGLWEFTQSFNF